MKLKFFQTKAFKALQIEWDEILRRSGFKDAEKRQGANDQLRQRASNAYRGAPETIRENKAHYYELLGEFFYQEVFDDDVERLVMERRSEGVKIKDISRELRELGERSHRETIRHIIYKFEAKWGIKKR